MVIRLTPDIETVLEQQAKRQGTTPERLVLDTLGSVFLQPSSPKHAAGQATLFDFLSGYIGTIEGTGKCCRRIAVGTLLKGWLPSTRRDVCDRYR